MHSNRQVIFYLPFIAFDFCSEKRSGLASSSKVFLGWIEAMDGFQVDVIVGGHGLFQILPPMIQNPLFADETEPWREQQRFVLHHFDKTIASDPFHVVNFVWVTLDGQIRLRWNGIEKNVVNFVLSPRTKKNKRNQSQ